MNIQELQQITAPLSNSSVKNSISEEEPFWGKDGFTFDDVLDMFNPLHHLPVISRLYSEQSHDEACEGSKLVGGVLFGGLFGGVTGVLTSIANAAIRHETHQDISEHLLAMADSSEQDIANNKQYDNPFFAQLLNEGSDNDLYSNLSSNLSSNLYSVNAENHPSPVNSSRTGKSWGAV